MSDATLQGLEKYCVFRSGGHWFAAPAVTIREVATRPTMVSPPDFPAALAGLCHLRNEFVPVLSLERLLQQDTTSEPTSQQLLIMAAPANSCWALLVDEVSALATLDVAINTDNRALDAWSVAVMGSATFQGEVVRVLDVNGLHRLATQQFSTTSALSPSSTRGSSLVCQEASL